MFFEKAFQGVNDWWRYFIVTVVVFLGYLIGQIPMLLAFWKSSQDNPEIGFDEITKFGENPDFSIFGINSNMGLALLLMMFLGAIVAFYFIFRPMHQREFRTLTTPKSSINWSKIFFGFFCWLILILLIKTVGYFLDPDNYVFQFNLKSFLPLLLLGIFILPIQTSMEELFFRGYLMQGIGTGTKSKLIALLLSSVLFGLIHSANPEVDKFGFWTMQSYYIFAGLFLGLLTVMDDSLELALGAHAATNFAGIVFIGYEGATLQTDSLFTIVDVSPGLMIFEFMAAALIFLLIVKFRYGWEPFSKIMKPISKPDQYSSLDHLIESTQ